MSKDKRRRAERSAASIEWYLDRPNADGALSADASLALGAAELVIKVMEEQYEGLGAWVAAAEKAADAEAAYQLALKWGATKAVLDTLRTRADKSAKAVAIAERIDADDPAKVLRTYAAMKMVSAAGPASR